MLKWFNDGENATLPTNAGGAPKLVLVKALAE